MEWNLIKNADIVDKQHPKLIGKTGIYKNIGKPGSGISLKTPGRFSVCEDDQSPRIFRAALWTSRIESVSIA